MYYVLVRRIADFWSQEAYRLMALWDNTVHIRIGVLDLGGDPK
jgi:hypothetical protein